MTLADLKTAIDWAATEGWNPGLHDAETFHRIDPDGFFMGRLNGEPIASISAVDWGSGFGFIGLYIVTPSHRGQGYGLKLWQHAMERLKGKTIGLDGVVAQQANYARSGFEFAHRNLRFGGQAGDLAGPDYGRQVTGSQCDGLLSLDVAPALRSDYFRAWLEQTNGLVITGQESLVVARPCRHGVKLGPLIAPTREEAHRLLGAACARFPHETPIFLDIPESNPEALALVTSLSMTLEFETARMYCGPQPTLEPSRWFGVASLELG